MSMDFPATPTPGTIVTFANGQSYRWNGGQWDLIMAPLAGNISFPATQVPSADPNTLDDYEEGTWNPVIACGSGAFSNLTVPLAQYVKIGRFVAVQETINIIAAGTAGANITTSLPFAPATTALSCYGRESQVTGKALNGQLNGNLLSLLFYDNTLPIGNGYLLVLGFTYMTAT